MVQNIVRQVHIALLKRSKTISIAESCTGGFLSNLLTQLPQSSKYFKLGVVTYSNQSKEKILEINHSIILKKGAVSKEVARKMAKSVMKLAKTDFSIAITGIAGPSGGTQDKPKGTVFIAVAKKNKIVCNEYLFKGTRTEIRKKAALKSLELLLCVALSP
ncbi:MAG: CinA family protein [Candidatus Omnitrophica bacterium]|nr:CinA family protein [Candidatus Omnitrophota bacterium]